jgi:cation diffusion facilitator CzcD-associated flavoprotein CzcO
MSAFEEANKDLDYDVLIIGAGLSGLYTLHRIRQLGLRVKVLEAGEAEGGTWFWCVAVGNSREASANH